jgi:hypothetical protein
MSKRQRWVLRVYAAIVVAMLLYPPTRASIFSDDNRIEVNEGFQFIGQIGLASGKVATSTSVDLANLLVELLVVTLAGGALYASLRESGPR